MAGSLDQFGEIERAPGGEDRGPVAGWPASRECLVLLSESLGDRVFPLRPGENVIGRSSSADIRLPDPRVSGRHAAVVQADGRWLVRDLGSRNGTAVNGEPIEERALAPGDRIEIAGAATLFFTDRAIEDAGAPPLPDVQLDATGPMSVERPTDDGERGDQTGPPRPGRSTRRSIAVPVAEIEEAIRDVRPARVVGALDEQRLWILHQIGETVGSARSEPELLERVLELTMALIPADRGYVFLADPALRFAALPGPPAPAAARRRHAPDGTEPVAVSTTVLDDIVAHRRAIASTDAGADERFRGAVSVRRHRIHAVMGAPLVAKGRVLGVLYLDATAPGYLFNRAELLLLSAIGFQAGIALENVRFVHQLEERVRARTAETERLSEERARLLSIAAHDLKTPLSGILGYLEALLPQIEASDGAAWLAEEVRTIAESMRDMTELLTDLLDRQRAEAGRIDLAPEPTAVGDFLRDLARRYDRWARGAGRRLALALEEPLPPAELDRRRVAQVLNNLVHNAIKHTPRDGRVFLGARALRSGHLELLVGDEGRGFAGGETDKIVAEFERGPAPVGVGHGLGLAIVERLVALHGGDMRIESAPGHGARIFVRLPIRWRART